MGEFLSSYYLWIKVIHILAVISWMAGLLYLPRIFVYHAQQIEAGAAETGVFVVMERKLYHFIMNKAVAVVWIFGILLLAVPGVADFSSVWLWAKLVSVVAMTVFHVWLGRQQDAFEDGAKPHASRTYRMVNEVPAVLMLVIVVMVIVKPF